MSDPKIAPIIEDGQPPICSVECPSYKKFHKGKPCKLYSATDCGEVCVPQVLRTQAIVDNLRADAEYAETLSFAVGPASDGSPVSAELLGHMANVIAEHDNAHQPAEPEKPCETCGDGGIDCVGCPDCQGKDGG